MKNASLTRKSHFKPTITLSLVVAVSLSCLASAGTWPRFRGPNGQGISDARSIPVQWTESDYLWTIDLPGTGPSSPVVWDDKVFVTCADAQSPKGILLAINVDNGQILWTKEYPLPNSKMNNLNSYATGTPALTADRVYTLWSTANKALLVALDHEGREVFEREFGPVSSSHGPGVSPMVVNDLVVFTREQLRDRDSFWIALDAETGQTRWTVERQVGQISYSTPAVYSPRNGRPQLVFTSATHGISAVDPSTGTVLWETKDAFIARVVSSPVIARDLIIGTCGQGGSGKRITAVRPPANRSEEPRIAHKSEDLATTPYVSTSLYKDGLLFTFHDQGTICCRKADTGEILWSEKPAGRFYGSPVWVDGRIYCITRKGDVVVLKAAHKYELLAVNSLGEKSDATPAVADERMYLRTSSKLFCLKGKAK